jgi:hypothetical protein
MDVPDAEAAQELGSIAHGPVLLTAGEGIAVGLRCVFAHRTGLHLPLVLVARGVHADAAARRLRRHGGELSLELGPADGGPMVRLGEFASQSAGGDDEYRLESSYWHAGLPDSEDLTVTVAWPAIGLAAVSAGLQIPDLGVLARAALPLR